MAHEVESMVYEGQLPWHKLGTRITDATSFAEGFALAGLDWEVDTQSLFTADGVQVSHRASYRTSDGRILGVVGPRWEPLQNKEAFDLFEPLVESGELKLHTAGSLRGGERVWVLLKIAVPSAVVVPGDEIEKFVLLSNGHDGKLAVRMGFTPIRVVCANTMAMAHDAESSKLVRVRHTKSVVGNCERLRDIMCLANRDFEATAEQYRFLARRDICSADLRKYVKRILDINPTCSEMDLTPRRRNLLYTVLDQFEAGAGQDLAGVRGTWWGAYNAITHHASHKACRSAHNRLNSVWFGDNANLISDALTVALEMAV